jgi:hypothetical protein
MAVKPLAPPTMSRILLVCVFFGRENPAKAV